MIKKVFYVFLFLVSFLVFIYLLAVYNNNKSVDVIEEKELQSHLESSIIWLVENKAEALDDYTPMLWWVLNEAYKINKDPRIAEILSEYFSKYSTINNSVWGPLFEGRKRRYLSASLVEPYSYYYKHIIYALNCAENVGRDFPVVIEQNEADYCFQSSHLYRPACITHQLMGIHFMDINSCPGIDDAGAVVESLQADIINQLTWDIRVVDVYLQRVMMLMITGKAEQVKPVWVRRIMDAQNEDGGWANFDAIVKISGDRFLGFGPRNISIESNKSTFHATVQGTYLLSLSINNGKLYEKG